MLKTGAETDPIKFVVVLAGGHKSDPAIPVTSQLSGESMIRLVEGIRILRESPGAKLILSGGGSLILSLKPGLWPPSADSWECRKTT
jgi:uncharacterized SAM-binding protein YcdF (DUF218 family)